MLNQRFALIVVPAVFMLLGCGAPDGADDESSAASQAAIATSENPDIQSPEDVATARAAVMRDFGRLTDPSELAGVGISHRLPGYVHLDPLHVVPQDLLGKAVAYFDENQSAFPNKKFITVVDFKPRSDKYRFFLVDMEDGSVERYHTTHGRGSGPKEDADGYAPGFGNVPDSGKSSLGFVRTAEVYWGTYNRAIRLDGLSTTNSKIRERFIVFHGWDDTREANVIQAQSRGCITLDWGPKDAVLDKIKEGSLMYIGVSGGA